VVQRGLASFQNDNVQVVTISVDSVFSHKIFSLREGFEFPLLADFWPHGEVARRYGVFNDEGGFSDRGTFLVDREASSASRSTTAPTTAASRPTGWTPSTPCNGG
jgi:peroxiredoxin (alkyl hydroperoxide reductase subunit C)